MIEYASLKVLPKTKKEFDRQRTLTQGQVSANDYLQWLLTLTCKRGKK